jgi:hypothetical protein
MEGIFSDWGHQLLMNVTKVSYIKDFDHIKETTSPALLVILKLPKSLQII